jgi:hypothetical protein
MILPCTKRNDTRVAAGKGSAAIVQVFTTQQPPTGLLSSITAGVTKLVEATVSFAA